MTVSAAGAGTIDYESAPGAYDRGARQRRHRLQRHDRLLHCGRELHHRCRRRQRYSRRHRTGGRRQRQQCRHHGGRVRRERWSRHLQPYGGGGRFAIDAATGVVTVADDRGSTTRARHVALHHGARRRCFGARTAPTRLTPSQSRRPAVGAGRHRRCGGRRQHRRRCRRGARSVGIHVAAVDPDGGTVTYSLATRGGRFAITHLGYVSSSMTRTCSTTRPMPRTPSWFGRTMLPGMLSRPEFTIAVTDAAPTRRSTPSARPAPRSTRAFAAPRRARRDRRRREFERPVWQQRRSRHHGSILRPARRPRHLQPDGRRRRTVPINAGTGVVTVATDRTLNQDTRWRTTTSSPCWRAPAAFRHRRPSR